jgi:hypothetical protein
MPDRAAIQREGKAMFAARAVAFFLGIALLVFYALNPLWMQALLILLPAWLRWTGFLLGLASLGLSPNEPTLLLLCPHSLFARLSP